MSFTEVDGVRGMLVQMGLGTPSSRAFTVGGAVGVAMYALGLPKESFTDDGEMRPFTALSPHPSATNVHFLAVPVGAAIAAYLFT
jgi:hypothetical protein